MQPLKEELPLGSFPADSATSSTMDKQGSFTSPNNRKQCPKPYLQPDYQPERVASIVKAFLEGTEFVPSGINPVNKPLEDYMKSFMCASGLECEHLKQTLHLAAALIELGYHKSTFEEKKNLALFNWSAIYIDDRVTKDPIPFCEFSSRLLRGHSQLDPVLNMFTEVLNSMWDIYDPLAASAIFNYSLAFVMGSCIEPELENLPLTAGVERFPWYIRDLSGLSNAYALFAFPKKSNCNMLSVIQVLPDMNFWINLTNDLLSFHKEESIGEKGTYIYNRAKNENKSRYDTCIELVAELRKARRTIHTTLADNPAALERWKILENGYIEWHLMQDRYRLKDLGIHF